MKFALAILLAISCCVVKAQQEKHPLPSSLDECNSLFRMTIEKYIKHPPTLNTVSPDKSLTNSMTYLYRLGEHVEALIDDEASLLNVIEETVSVLQERRKYVYLLWAEQRLRKVMETRGGQYRKCSQGEILTLYETLSEINLTLITENMLAQEISTQLGKLYECLENEYKRTARLRGIEKQMDAYSLEAESRKLHLRKTLNDF